MYGPACTAHFPVLATTPYSFSRVLLSRAACLLAECVSCTAGDPCRRHVQQARFLGRGGGCLKEYCNGLSCGDQRGFKSSLLKPTQASYSCSPTCPTCPCELEGLTYRQPGPTSLQCLDWLHVLSSSGNAGPEGGVIVGWLPSRIAAFMARASSQSASFQRDP